MAKGILQKESEELGIKMVSSYGVCVWGHRMKSSWLIMIKNNLCLAYFARWDERPLSCINKQRDWIPIRRWHSSIISNHNTIFSTFTLNVLWYLRFVTFVLFTCSLSASDSPFHFVLYVKQKAYIFSISYIHLPS